PSKFDSSQLVDVYISVIGGKVGTTNLLAPKISPLVLSPKKIGEDMAKETTKSWNGTIKLTVQQAQQ
ncbi:unnamed protein product, partial [Prunus brigantina]